MNKFSKIMMINGQPAVVTKVVICFPVSAQHVKYVFMSKIWSGIEHCQPLKESLFQGYVPGYFASCI